MSGHKCYYEILPISFLGKIHKMCKAVDTAFLRERKYAVRIFLKTDFDGNRFLKTVFFTVLKKSRRTFGPSAFGNVDNMLAVGV